MSELRAIIEQPEVSFQSVGKVATCPRCGFWRVTVFMEPIYADHLCAVDGEAVLVVWGRQALAGV